MTTDPHIDLHVLGSYVSGRLNDPAAWSVETHVTACQPCRDRLADLPMPQMDDVGRRSEVVWAETTWRLDRPGRRPVERVLERTGVPDHLARLLAATPSLTVPWLLAVAAVLAFAVAASWAGSDGTGDPGWTMVLFLVVAPLVPLAGVAAAFGPVVDPTYEISVAAPLSMTRLLFIRAVAVLSASFALAVLASLLLPTFDWTVAAWILPAMALTAVAMALSTTLEPLLASSAVATAWVAIVVATELRSEVALLAFRGAGQLTAAGALAAAVAVLFVRRQRFDADVLP